MSRCRSRLALPCPVVLALAWRRRRNSRLLANFLQLRLRSLRSGGLVALVILGAAFIHGVASAQTPPCRLQVPPSEQFDELFQQVQLKRIFPDGKTFADLHSDDAPNTILADYQAHKDKPDFDLSEFVHRHFSMPIEGPDVRPALPGEPLETYIARLWDVLRHRSGEMVYSSLLPLPYPYVVPGGRFRELNVALYPVRRGEGLLEAVEIDRQQRHGPDGVETVAIGEPSGAEIPSRFGRRA
jgi:hypothetical protein